ncbi:leucine-rich repeat, cysteine-containing subtype protein [Tanacetum coccineum]
MTNNNTPASHHKLGLVVSSDSGRVLRRSARLSLNSTSYDVVENVVDKSSRKRKAVDVSGLNGTDGVETFYNAVEKFSRKIKAAAVKVENKEEVDGSGLNGTDGVVSDTSGVLVSDMDTEQPDKNEIETVTGDKESEGDVGSQSLNLRSGNNKVVLLPDLNQLADDEKLSPAASKDDKETQDRVSEEGSVGIGRTTSWRRFSRQDKNKGVSVVDVERDMEIDLGKDVDIGEKGKGKVIEINSSSSDSGPDNMDEDFVLGNATRIALEEKGKEKIAEVDSSSRSRDRNEELGAGLMDDGTIAAADAGSLGIAAIGKASTSSSRMRERFKDAAKKNATRFAYFSHQPEDEGLDIDDDEEDEPQPPQTEANADEEDWPGPFSTAMKIINDRTANTPPQKKTKAESVPLIWLPKEKQQRVRRAPPSLQDLCMTIMSQHVDAITSLESSGRCLPDYVLLPLLALLPSRLSALTNISLKGACRLSDAGLKALVDSAPALRSINLGCCSLLTVDAINNLADKLGPVLKELYIDAKHILPALLKLEQLEVLSVAHNESIDNSFIIKFVAARGFMDEIIELANDLMDQKLHTYAEKSDNKRIGRDFIHKKNNHGHQQQPFKKQNVAKVYNMGTGEKKPYGGNLPKCTKFHFHHNGPCTLTR